MLPIRARSKRKGSAFERDVVACLRENGFPYAGRSYGAGWPEDVGDVDGLSEVRREISSGFACSGLDY